MSRDNKPEDKAPELAATQDTTVKTPDTSSTTEKISAEERRQMLLERRAAAGVHTERGSVSKHGHKKHIPHGFTGMYVSPHAAEGMYNRGYDLVTDDNGAVCTLRANDHMGATDTRLVLVMAPDEIVAADQAADAARSQNASQGTGQDFGPDYDHS